MPSQYNSSINKTLSGWIAYHLTIHANIVQLTDDLNIDATLVM
jgi:hypothetical protein